MSKSDDRTTERKKQLYDKLDFASSKMSEMVRYIGFGLVAIVYTLMTSQAAYASAATRDHPRLTHCLLFLGCASIMFDYLQYLCAYEDAAASSYFPKRAFGSTIFAICQNLFFRAKQVTTIVGVIAFGVLLWLTQGALNGPSDCQQKRASRSAIVQVAAPIPRFGRATHSEFVLFDD